MPGASLTTEDIAELVDFLRFLSEWVAADRDRLSTSLPEFVNDHPYGVGVLHQISLASGTCSAVALRATS
jgi:hypothetical protein